jgi:hypothetical protein
MAFRGCSLKECIRNLGWVYIINMSGEIIPVSVGKV